MKIILTCSPNEGPTQGARTLLTALHLLAELRHVVWPYGSEELDVVVAVIFCHLLSCGFVWSLKRKAKPLGEN